MIPFLSDTTTGWAGDNDLAASYNSSNWRNNDLLKMLQKLGI
jgi:hypothetical protein